ncbi:MAG: hypothetical protein LBH71_04865, partial [Oscillospiraceae bacterium]|nr:hypothetical protein [Oscillospiraceae bacterium]
MTLVLVLSLAACGGKNSENPGNIIRGLEEDAGQAMDSLINWMKDGKFSYDYTMTSEGPEGKVDGSGSMAMDGDKLSVSTELTVDGKLVKSRFIQKDDKTYVIDEGSKTIMEMALGL